MSSPSIESASSDAALWFPVPSAGLPQRCSPSGSRVLWFRPGRRVFVAGWRVVKLMAGARLADSTTSAASRYLLIRLRE